jgi:hypothetical protein
MATLKNTTINDTGFLQLPVGTTANRPATPSQGMLRYNTTLGAAEEYTGSTWKRLDNIVTATTTGTFYEQNIDDTGIPYRVHVWHGAGTFVPATSGTVEYLIVAGGGGGAGGNPSADGNGGGGGGGVLQGTAFVTPQTYNIAVGNGGSAGAQSATSPGGDGGNSSAFGLTATGGGGGGSDGALNGRAGGSGGGASTSGAGGVGGTAVAGQGQAGGSANAPGGGGPGGGGGGGGGAGGPGGNGNQNQNGGAGGVGLSSSITGKTVWYGAGGGGSTWTSTGGAGGVNGGGFGASRPGAYAARPGSPNSGAGGGGGTATFAAGAGGSGIVVVRYKRTSSALSAPPAIPTNGLVYHLDAGDLDSYNYGEAVTTTTWRDISGKGSNFSFQGTQAHSYRYGGALLMNGTNNYLTTPYNATHMDFRYGQTICGWMEPSTNTGRRNLHDQAYAGSGTLTHEPGGEINYYFGTGGENNSPYVGVGSGHTYFAGEGPMFFAASRNQRHNVVQWWKNDSVNTQSAGSYDLTTNSGSRIQIGLGYTGTYWQGWLYMQLCYNRGLGELEILQIYNATKGRFGK